MTAVAERGREGRGTTTVMGSSIYAPHVRARPVFDPARTAAAEAALDADADRWAAAEHGVSIPVHSYEPDLWDDDTESYVEGRDGSDGDESDVEDAVYARQSGRHDDPNEEYDPDVDVDDADGGLGSWRRSFDPALNHTDSIPQYAQLPVGDNLAVLLEGQSGLTVDRIRELCGRKSGQRVPETWRPDWDSLALAVYRLQGSGDLKQRTARQKSLADVTRPGAAVNTAVQQIKRLARLGKELSPATDGRSRGSDRTVDARVDPALVAPVERDRWQVEMERRGNLFGYRAIGDDRIPGV